MAENGNVTDRIRRFGRAALAGNPPVGASSPRARCPLRLFFC